MIYGYQGALQQGNPYGMGGGMSQFAPPMPPMMPGTGYGAQMPNGANTTGEVEAQRRRLKDLGLDDTMIDDALKFKSGLYQQRDEMKQKLYDSALGGLKDTGAGMASIAKDAGAGIMQYGKSL
jgi:hypothetical protein